MTELKMKTVTDCIDLDDLFDCKTLDYAIDELLKLKWRSKGNINCRMSDYGYDSPPDLCIDYERLETEVEQVNRLHKENIEKLWRAKQDMYKRDAYLKQLKELKAKYEPEKT